MKTTTIASPLITSDSLDGSIMGMDAKGMDMATYFMRDKIYSNKVLAVVREYICNAIDEHVKFNIKKPIEAGLRHVGNEVEFYVRDFAKGLSEEKIRSIFGMYFRSTKSQNNQGIGGFGIGSKSFHCYTDTFNVTSYHNNSKTTYVCTLGGGDNGIPVGHIFKIDDCKDNQTGIEISGIINIKDQHKFESYLHRFCNHALYPVKLNLFGKEYNSPKPVREFTKDDIRFRLFEDKDSLHGQIMLQMGGVCYDYLNNLYLNNLRSYVKVKSNHVLVIDVPIGSMSIPISRENFEDNASNRKYKDKILKHIEDLMDQDMQIFKDKKITDLVNDALKNGFSNHQLENEWFTFNKVALYPDLHKFLNQISLLNFGAEQFHDSKRVIVTIPNNSASDYWREKLKNHASQYKQSYIVINEHYVPHNNDELNEKYHFISVKKIKFDRQSKSKAKFKFYFDKRDCGDKSALEIHNFLRKRLNLPEASSLNEAKTQNEQYIKDCACSKELKTLTLHHQMDYNCAFVRSATLRRQLNDIGIYNINHPTIIQAKSRIQKIEEENRKMNTDIYNAKQIWIPFNKRTQNLIKYHKNSLRIINIYNKIKNNNEIFNKTFTCIEKTPYYSRPQFTRQEVRQILKMKA